MCLLSWVSGTSRAHTVLSVKNQLFTEFLTLEFSFCCAYTGLLASETEAFLDEADCKILCSTVYVVFGWGLVNLIRSDETTDEPPRNLD